MVPTKVTGSDVEIKYEDQVKINTFSRLYQKSRDVAAELKKLDEMKQKMEDCYEELELISEDTVAYNFADCYITISSEKAVELVEKDLKEAKATIEERSQERNEMKKCMDKLKSELYQKFGDSINLDE